MEKTLKRRLVRHTTSSVDGRALVPPWHPADVVPEGLWGAARARLGADAAIMCGFTAPECTQGDSPYPETTDTMERVHHLPDPGLGDHQIAIDPGGALTWGRSDIDGAPIIVMVAESGSDRHLAGPLGGGPATGGRVPHPGLVGEISLLPLPTLDGYTGARAIFVFPSERDGPRLPETGLKLQSSEVLDGWVQWLRYDLVNAPR